MKLNNTVQIILGLLLVMCFLYIFYLTYFKIHTKNFIDLHDGIAYTATDKEAAELKKNDHNNLKFTHSFWLFITELPQTDQNMSILEHGLDSHDFKFSVKLDSLATLEVKSKNKSSNKEDNLIIEHDNILLQKWNHITIVQDVNTMDLYIDGRGG